MRGHPPPMSLGDACSKSLPERLALAAGGRDMLLTFLAALAAPAVGPCGPVARRSACPEAVALVAEWELAALATTLPKAIDAVNDAGMDRSAEDVAAWKARAAKVA